MRKTGIAKRLLVYITAAAVVFGSALAGTSFSSEAASYIQYDNIIIRDAANGEILGGIAKGTEVEILESATGTDGKQWNHVKYAANGTTHEGWVRADLMTDDKSKVEPDAAPEQEQPSTETPDVETPTTEPTQEPEEEPDIDNELEVVIPDQNVSGEGYEATGDNTFDICGVTMTIAEDFADDKIPSGFEKKDIAYNDRTVKGAKYKYGEVSLIFLKDDAGNGEFFVLDSERNTVHSFIKISAGSNALILLVPPADTVIASSYGKTLYALDEDTAVTAYQFAQQTELLDVGTNPAEYFYVYGITESGLPDWYLLDDVEKTFIRATADLTVELDALSGTQIVVQEMESDDSLEKMIIVVMAAIILICIILIIIFGVRSFRARRGYYEEEDDFEEEDELGFIQRRREDRKYRKFMENFEEEGDEDVSNLLPKQKVDEYLQKEEMVEVSEEVPAEEPVNEEPLVEEQIVEEQIVEEQPAEEQPVEEQPTEESVEEDILAARLELEEAVRREMPMDDYDIPVSDTEDYDLTDDVTEEDKKEFDEIENILIAGLAELEKETDTEKEEKQPETVPVEAPKTQPEDEWKDLEFLDI